MRTQEFTAFFSYSHHDAKVDNILIEYLTEKLEDRVTSKLTNARFFIWKDTSNLRVGEKWNDSIENSIVRSSIFILILSPKWLESDYCRKEYLFFESNVESRRQFGEYVVPILIRDLDIQKRHFDTEQKSVFTSINTRQYVRLDSKDFLSMQADAKIVFLDKIADDICGMLERIRSADDAAVPNSEKFYNRRPRLKAEFDASAHNFEEVDPVSVAEVLVENTKGSPKHNVYAHIDFLPKLYVQSGNARVEFGIRRAVLALHAADAPLLRNDEWDRNSSASKGAYYIKSRKHPQSLSVCMDPLPGQSVLREVPLPPAEGENRLSKIAVAETEIDSKSVKAVLSINLSAEGLFVFAEDGQRSSASTLRKIAAIINVAAEKSITAKSGILERDIPVTERKK